MAPINLRQKNWVQVFDKYYLNTQHSKTLTYFSILSQRMDFLRVVVEFESYEAKLLIEYRALASLTVTCVLECCTTPSLTRF